MRDGEPKEATITLIPFPASRIFAIRYGERPRYVFFCGLVFQPLDYNLYATFQFRNPRVRTFFQNYVKEAIFKDREDVVVLTRVESDRMTTYLSGFTESVIDEINGVKVKSLSHAQELLYSEDQSEFITIKCNGVTRPIVIPSAEVASCNERIMTRMGIPQPYYLGTR